MPGIYFGGVSNAYTGNDVAWSPHNCIMGGGDFEDAAEITVANNTVSDCTFETGDAGAFYTCGQRGTAFVNRGNVLRNNTFARIRNTAGLGVQIASNRRGVLGRPDERLARRGQSLRRLPRRSARRRRAAQHDRGQHVRPLRHRPLHQRPGRTWDAGTVNCTDVAPPRARDDVLERRGAVDALRGARRRAVGGAVARDGGGSATRRPGCRTRRACGAIRTAGAASC